MLSRALSFRIVIICSLLSAGSVLAQLRGNQPNGQRDNKSGHEKSVILYSFDDRDRHEWIGSNHFEGFLITEEWSSTGDYSIKGILAQQNLTDWEPEMTKFYRPYGIDFSKYISISADVRHQKGNCDPGNGLYARIYLTDADENWIGNGEKVLINSEMRTVTMNLPDDLADGVNPAKLSNIGRLSVQFIPCPSATGNMDIYIDNITAKLSD